MIRTHGTLSRRIRLAAGIAGLLLLAVTGCRLDFPDPSAALDAQNERGPNSRSITAFSFPIVSATGTIDQEQRTIAVTVPYGRDVTALVATFATTGASVTVGSTVQESGVTPNDFTDPIVYKVTSASGRTAQYTVTASAAPAPGLSSSKAITDFSFPSIAATSAVDESAKTIAIAVPAGTDVTDLVAVFSTTGASVTVGSTTQVSGTTRNDFSSPVTYTVTAADGSSAAYQAAVTIAASSANIGFMSFYFPELNIGPATIDNGARTITETVPNATVVTALTALFIATPGTTVTVGSTVLQAADGSVNDFSRPVLYTITAADGSSVSYTVTVTVADPPSSSSKAFTAFYIGRWPLLDEQAKSVESSVLPGTDRTALVARFVTTGASVKVGSVPQQTGVTPNNFNNPVIYEVTAADGSTASYTVTVKLAPELYDFSFPSVPLAVVDTDTYRRTVAVSVPYGTGVTSLVATFRTDGASGVEVGAASQTSGVTANNFSSPLTYSVRGTDGSSADYVVTVNVRPGGSEKAVTYFRVTAVYNIGDMGSGYDEYWVMDYEGQVDQVTRTIHIYLSPYYPLEDASTFFTTTGVAVKVDSAEYPVVNGEVSVPFRPNVITVTAADGSTASYSVFWDWLSMALAPAQLGPGGAAGHRHWL